MCVKIVFERFLNFWLGFIELFTFFNTKDESAAHRWINLRLAYSPDGEA